MPLTSWKRLIVPGFRARDAVRLSADAIRTRHPPICRSADPVLASRCASRFPSSLVNRKHPDLYSNGVGGIVIDWAAVSINCAYYADGGSQTQECDPPGRTAGCMPGCRRGWCDPESRRNYGGCGWADKHLSHMMKMQDETRARGGYNEIVLDGMYAPP